MGQHPVDRLAPDSAGRGEGFGGVLGDTWGGSEDDLGKVVGKVSGEVIRGLKGVLGRV